MGKPVQSFFPNFFLPPLLPPFSPSVHSHVQPTFTQDSELQWSMQMRSGYAVHADTQ